MCEALLTLHAIADEACAGLGVPLRDSGVDGCRYRARGRELLARTGSLARLESHFLRVLPKVRTPTSGTSVSSLSRYACVQRPGVTVGWHKIPARHAGADLRADHANLLLLPWPLRVRESDFHPVEGSIQRQAKEPFGFFEFAPSEPLDLDLVSRVLVAAQEEVDSVHVVILPESAVDEDDINDLEILLDHHGVVMLQTGVRRRAQPGRLAGNWVHTGVSPNLVKGGAVSDSTPEAWFHIRQNKHHRWSLDEEQIYQYHLGGALHPRVRWWEATEVPRRTIQFLELGESIVLVSLVCEDLAQIDDVADVIRSVGPTIVATLVLDGPQLTSRWSARYASVLADDPGSAVVTLTSFGMAERCRPRGRTSSPVVALWKDPTRGTREIPLEDGAHGIVVTTCGERGTRRTADGRYPVDNTTNWFDVAISQIRAAPAGPRAATSLPKTRTPPLLEVVEVTILTSFAQAVAEALAEAPERVEDVLADAHPGAAWRAGFGITAPSQQLSEAIEWVSRAVRSTASGGDAATLDSTLIATQRSKPGELGLEQLARQVLRATLEQRRFLTKERTTMPRLG
jgi:hypothetical protein